MCPSGNCVNELASYCVGITAGEGQLADCISDKITESETGNSEEGEDSHTQHARTGRTQSRGVRQ